jgi:hypothetical protein
MSWAGVLTTIDTHLATAAGVVDALDTRQEPFDVRRGEPFGALKRQVAYWYNGDQESTSGGRTFGKNNVEEKLVIRWYWPVLNRDDNFSSYIETQLQAANRATQAALLGDGTLGGNSIDLTIESVTAGWQSVGEAWIRVLTIPLLVDMAWTEDIAI